MPTSALMSAVSSSSSGRRRRACGAQNTSPRAPASFSRDRASPAARRSRHGRVSSGSDFALEEVEHRGPVSCRKADSRDAPGSGKARILPSRRDAPGHNAPTPAHRIDAALPPPTANRVRIIGGAWRRRVIRFPPAAGVRPTPDRVRETLFNWLGQDLSGQALPRSLRRVRRADARSGLPRRRRWRSPSTGTANWWRRCARPAAVLGASAIEAAVGDARTFIASERRDFDVIFLDPPFDEDPWPWLLPACAGRLVPGGFLYAEAGARARSRRRSASPGAATRRDGALSSFPPGGMPRRP